MEAEITWQVCSSFECRGNFITLAFRIKWSLVLGQVETLEFNRTKYEWPCNFLLQCPLETGGQIRIKLFIFSLAGVQLAGSPLSLSRLLLGLLLLALLATLCLLGRLLRRLQLLLFLLLQALFERIGCVSQDPLLLLELGIGASVKLSESRRRVLARFPEVFGLQHVLVALEHPLGRAARRLQEEGTSDEGQGVSEGRSVLLFFGGYELLVFFGQLDLVQHAVIERLIRLFIAEAEPCSIELAFFADHSPVLGHELAHSKQDHGSLFFDLVERYLNFPVIVDLQDIVPRIILVRHVVLRTAPAIGVHSGQDLALGVEDNSLWVVLALRGLVEGVICSREGKAAEPAG